MPVSQDHHEASQTQLGSLQTELISYILELTGDPQSIRKARLAFKLLRDAGNLLVTILGVSEGGLIPAEVLQTFERATRFLVRQGYNITAAVYLQNVLQLLPTLPERTDSIDINLFRGLCAVSASDSTQLAQHLLTAAYHRNLHELALGLHITTAAADTILQGLPHLQRASLKVRSTINAFTVWRPSADLSNMAGSLSLCCDPSTRLDLAGLSTATKLQALSLDLEDYFSIDPNVNSLSVISCLTALQSLRLISSSYRTMPAATAQALTALQQLRSLDARLSRWPADSWSVLATLPSLSELIVGSITIETAAPPAAAVTSIKCKDHLQLDHPAEQLPGCLAAQLPQLQKLQAYLQDDTAASLQKLAAALQHHTALQALKLQSFAAHVQPPPAWQQQQLSTLPELQLLDLNCAMDPNSLLADIAGCSKLTSLSLKNRTGADITAAGLAALEAGLCSRTLEVVSLSDLSLEAGVQLLGLQLPRLRDAMLHLRMPEGLMKPDASKAEQRSVVEGQLLPAGAGWKIREWLRSCMLSCSRADYRDTWLTRCFVDLEREL